MNFWPFSKSGREGESEREQARPADPVQALEDAIGEHAAEILAIARPAIHLKEGGATRTKIGGVPDLPTVFEWPTWDEKPMAFIGQIDLGTLPIESDLPRSGLLSFFYDGNLKSWGFLPSDRGAGRVFHWDGVELSPRVFPPGLSEHSRFSELHLAGAAQPQWPDTESIEILLPDLPGGIADEYFELVEHLGTQLVNTQHQLLGYPYCIQGEMMTECQLTSNGIDCGGTGYLEEERTKALLPGARDWRLLFQVDTEEKAGMMWGDCGMLYYWIREEDLRAGSFGNVWLISQCF